MTVKTDDEFFVRADAHIDLSNDQLAHARMGVVSASMMYATARFNSWVTACGSTSREDMTARSEQTLDDFVDQYRHMLAENLVDHSTHFDERMAPKPNA
jgi:hypothetical protein